MEILTTICLSALQKCGEKCENRWVILSFQFQDGSDGVVCLPLFRHPGLHDDCRDRSLSLSLVDGSDDNSRDAEAHFPFSSA